MSLELENNLLKCPYCDCVFESPILLPCGNRICLNDLIIHLEKKSVHCFVCNEQHPLLIDELKENNQLVKNFLTSSLIDLNSNLDKTFETRFSAKKNCLNLKELISNFEKVKSNPLMFISEYIADVINEIDIKRDQEMIEIDKYYSKMIQTLRKFESECNKSILEDKRNNETFPTNDDKISIQKWEDSLNSFQIDQQEWQKILIETEKKQKIYKELLKNIKLKLLQGKHYEFNKFEQIERNNRIYFGNLTINNDSNRQFDSKIVTNDEMTSDLLGLFDKTIHKSEYKWKLVYRGSDDGFSSESFHNKCDGYPTTLTLIKSEKSNVFGAFASDAMWKSKGSWQRASNSFIFSLVNNSMSTPFRVDCSDASKAIYCHSNWGAAFGFGCDLIIANDCNLNYESFSNLGHSYNQLTTMPLCKKELLKGESKRAQHLLAGSLNFKVDEVEVFYGIQI
jgi:hypothetical protein